MASRPIENSPWPAQTSVADSSSSSPHNRRSSKRRRVYDYSLDTRGSTSKSARQVVADQGLVQKAQTDCQINSGNNIFSCFPTADTVIAQHEWASFVWNSRRPELTQTNLVDIFLFHGDSRQQILHIHDFPNPADQAGLYTTRVNDSWWGTNGDKWAGENISYPFYWVIIRSDKTLDGNEIAQPTFTAVQTTFADSVVASMSSSSAAAASSASVLASLSSVAASIAATASRTSTAQPTSGNVQDDSSGSGFPHWAIAVIVVLGFLAIAATCVLAFLILRRIRRRNAELDSNRNSIGSASPMMAHVGHSAGSPLLVSNAPMGQPSSVDHGGGGGVGGGGVGMGIVGGGGTRDAHSMVSPDGASTISRTGSAGEGGPFSGADAAIMADAFRKMLRKPDFAGRPVEEGDSPEAPERQSEMINRELAEEGRDIRSVSSSRGVKVETMSDSGDTVQDYQR